LLLSYLATISDNDIFTEALNKKCLDAKPLDDKESYNIRRSLLINRLIDKNRELRENIEKIEQEIHFNQIIGQLREVTPVGSFISEPESPRWKRLARKLQAGIENNDPGKRKKQI
jgi:hypothetical protein